MRAWRNNSFHYYNLLPAKMQNVVCTIYGRKQRKVRYRGEFTDYLYWLESSQWWSATEIEEYQVKKLCELLHCTYNNISYYKEVLHIRDIRRENIKSFSDFKKLPLLYREDVHNLRNKMLFSASQGANRFALLQTAQAEKVCSFLQLKKLYNFSGRFGGDIRSVLVAESCFAFGKC